MDQILTVFGIDWKILLVQVVNFSVLLTILWYLLYKPFLRLIESRRTQIIEGVAKAERADAALRDADSKKADIIAKASLDAEALMTQARENAKRKETQLVTQAEEKAVRVVHEAEVKAQEMAREAIEKNRDEIAKLVVLGVEKTMQTRS